MNSLQQIAERLQREQTVISSHIIEPAAEPVLGPLAAAGPRAAGAPEEYSQVIEAIREGYELHYGTPRIVAGHDEDLALLAGDYLYALGLERLAALGDSEAVAELSDLISHCAACHVEGTERFVPALWLATTIAVGCGANEAHRSAKAAARGADPPSVDSLLGPALEIAAAAGLEIDLDRLAESIDFAAPRPADSG